jgi:hypothetical protein|tara:strand:- start:675 stop:1082 length:408 start_codon:yes stop_codon:yes gene_type:complete
MNFKIVIQDWNSRPWWMSLIFYFCIYMTFIYMPFDLFLKPVAEDEEIWFGFTLTGWYAKATEPLHWLIYGFGAYGFWRMKKWMWPWASVYVAQIVIAMFVWNILKDNNLMAASISALIFCIPMVALWRSKGKFTG